MNCYAKDVVKIAIEEVGYIEKKSNSNLDDKNANAGDKNYTKYARDLDKIKTFYNGAKQGFAWCEVFVDWCFVKAFGESEAKRLLFQPDKSTGAGTKYSIEFYKKNSAWYTTPDIGDQIYLNDGAHTGLVVGVYDTTNEIEVVEGNANNRVELNRYNISDSYITGYGRPCYDVYESENEAEEIENITDAGGDGYKENAIAKFLKKIVALIDKIIELLS